MGNFESDYALYGTPGEKYAEYILKKYCDAENVKRVNAKDAYDLIGVHHKSYEIKNDRISSSTGKLYIETYNPKCGKESGLCASKSHGWIVLSLDEINGFANANAYLFLTNELRKFIENQSARLKAAKNFVENKGNQNSNGYLIPIWLFRDNLDNHQFGCLKLTHNDIIEYIKLTNNLNGKIAFANRLRENKNGELKLDNTLTHMEIMRRLLVRNGNLGLSQQECHRRGIKNEREPISKLRQEYRFDESIKTISENGLTYWIMADEIIWMEKKRLKCMNEQMDIFKEGRKFLTKV